MCEECKKFAERAYKLEKCAVLRQLENARLREAISDTIARADDYADSYITRPIRDLPKKSRQSTQDTPGKLAPSDSPGTGQAAGEVNGPLGGQRDLPAASRHTSQASQAGVVVWNDTPDTVIWLDYAVGHRVPRTSTRIGYGEGIDTSLMGLTIRHASNAAFPIPAKGSNPEEHDRACELTDGALWMCTKECPVRLKFSVSSQAQHAFKKEDHACSTGDCSHNTQHECDVTLARDFPTTTVQDSGEK